MHKVHQCITLYNPGLTGFFPEGSWSTNKMQWNNNLLFGVLVDTKCKHFTHCLHFSLLLQGSEKYYVTHKISTRVTYLNTTKGVHVCTLWWEFVWFFFWNWNLQMTWILVGSLHIKAPIDTSKFLLPVLVPAISLFSEAFWHYKRYEPPFSMGYVNKVTALHFQMEVPGKVLLPSHMLQHYTYPHLKTNHLLLDEFSHFYFLQLYSFPPLGA